MALGECNCWNAMHANVTAMSSAPAWIADRAVNGSVQTASRILTLLRLLADGHGRVLGRGLAGGALLLTTLMRGRACGSPYGTISISTSSTPSMMTRRRPMSSCRSKRRRNAEKSMSGIDAYGWLRDKEQATVFDKRQLLSCNDARHLPLPSRTLNHKTSYEPGMPSRRQGKPAISRHLPTGESGRRNPRLPLQENPMQMYHRLNVC
jgi:hypothetical protein